MKSILEITLSRLFSVPLALTVLLLGAAGCDSPEYFDTGDVEPDNTEEIDGPTDTDETPCGPGLESNTDGDCADINECLLDEAPCASDRICVDTPEAFECICPSGTYAKSESGPCESRFDTEGPVLDGDMLLVVNTSTAQGSTASLTRSADANEIRQADLSRGKSDLILSSHPHWMIPAGASFLASNPVMPQPIPYELGDKRTFYARADGGEVQAQLMYRGEFVDVWAQNTVIISGQKAQELGTEFDEQMYPLIAERFAQPSDVDGDGRVALLFFEFNEPMWAGYFSAKDFSDASNSNAMEILYLNDSTLFSIKNTIVHELQHLAFFAQKSLREQMPLADVYSCTWLNEGLSVSSEHEYSGPRQQQIAQTSVAKSIRDGRPLIRWDPNNNSDDGYTLSYLFTQYLRAHSSAPESIFQELIREKGCSPETVETVVKKQIHEDLDFAELMVRFRLAMKLLEYTGPFGFNGEDAFDLVRVLPAAELPQELEASGAIWLETGGHYESATPQSDDLRFIGVTTTSSF